MNKTRSGGEGNVAADILSERVWQATIISSTVAVLLFSIYCLSHGITIIFMHLYYFPIVLLAYRYRSRGFVLAVLLSLTYIWLSYFYDAGQADIITGAWYRFFVFIGIAAVIAYLSEQLAGGQKALLASEMKYRTFFNTSMDCVFITTLDGRWVDFNDAAVAFFGYGSREELAGVKIGDLYARPADRNDHIRNIQEKEYSLEYPVNLKKKDGTVINTLITTIPRKDGDGTIIGFQGTIRDITERRHTAERLDQQFRFLQQLIDTIPSPVFYKDANGIYIGCNHSFENYLGRTRDQIIGKSVYQISPKELADTYFAKDKELLDHPGTQRYEARVKYADSSVHDVIFYKATFSDTHGAVQGLVGIILDITERKHAEESVRQSFALLKSVFDSPKDVVIFALDRQYRYIAFNDNHRQTMKQIWGADISVGASMPGFITSEEDRNRAISNFDRALLGESFTQVEAYGNAALARRWYEDIYNPITDSNGNVIGLTLFLTDITDRKRGEDALRLQNQIFETIAEGVYLIRASDGTIVYTNEKFDRMFRYAKGEAIGRHVSVVNAPEEGTSSRDTADRIMKALHETGEWRGEVKNITKDGTMFWSLAVVSTFEHPEFGSVWISAHTDINGRKIAEEALRESEKRYRDMFEINNAVMLILDPEDGRIVDANSAACRYYGYTREEITGLVIMQINIQDSDATRDDLARARGSQGAVFQFRHRKKDGELRDVEVFSGPIFLGGRRLLHSIIQDVTDRKKVEKAVEAAVNLNQLIDTLSISESMSFTLDEAQRLTSSGIGFFHFVNEGEKTIQLIAWSSETRKHCFIPKEPEKNYPVEKGGVWLDALRERRPVIHNDYASLPHKKGLPEGHVPVIRELVVPIFDEDRIVAIIGVGNKARDYDERDTNVLTLLAKNTWTLIQRKRVDEALRDSEQKFRDIFNNTTDAIHIHEIREDGIPGRFTDVNDISCRMLGYTREELLNMTPLDIATEYHNPPIATIFESQRMLGVARFETEHRTKDGRAIPVEVNTHVVTIQGRKLMLGVVRDITERKKAEALLKHFNEELEQDVKIRTEELNASLDEKVMLLREVHHRVKNNLQIIISLVNLQMRQIDDERLKQVMAETQNRVKAMSLVHEKLYQSGDIAHISLADYTRFMATQLLNFYGVNSRRVKVTIDIGTIMLDINTAIPLGLIINELISNALKHAFPGNTQGMLSVSARDEGDLVHLTIQDDGKGLPPDLDWRTAESLGLRLVVSLVEQLDGTIELDRSAGTRFVIVVQKKE
ncbi:PAS domain S-box protein [uncultured Methanoregula sp.]|uniref:PAS domain S-box protein n=1 Tax=uncultured Methanoregula sp. TaxID=1005933 RepID=UPI002AAB98A7|nr:PAS domain S-box protein [uncultured Methanoregula sp.]